MSSNIIPKVESTRINASITFFVFLFYLIAVTIISKQFPDLSKTSTVVLLIFNVSLFTLIVTMLNFGSFLRKKLSQVSKYSKWYGHDESILLNTKGFQNLIDTSVSKVIVGASIFLLSLGFFSNDVADGLISLISLSDSSYSTLSHVIVGVIAFAIALILGYLGWKESDYKSRFSWLYIFKIRIDRIEKRKRSQLVIEVGEHLKMIDTIGEHDHQYQILDYYHRRISELFVDYQGFIKHIKDQFDHDKTGLWLYPEFTVFINNISSNSQRFNSNNVLKSSTKIHLMNFDDDVEDHRVTIFDILFDRKKSSEIYTQAFSLKHYFRQMAEVDYIITIVTNFMLFNFVFERSKNLSLNDFINIDTIFKKEEEDAQRIEKYKNEIIIMSVTKFFLKNRDPHFDKIEPVNIRFRTREGYDLRDYVKDYNTDSNLLDDLLTYMENEIKPVIDMKSIEHKDWSNTYEILEDFSSQYKVHKIDTNMAFKGEYKLLERNRAPFGFVPFKIINSGYSYREYLRLMYMIRDNVIEEIHDAIDNLSMLIGDIKHTDLVFNQIRM